MNKLVIKSIVTKKFNPAPSYNKDNDNKVFHNFLKQDYKANEPDTKLIGDIIYIYTKKQGWTYLVVVVDLFDLKVIGYEYGTHMNEDLVIKALNKAKLNRILKLGCIFHSDRGIQYTSNAFEQYYLIATSFIHILKKLSI